MIHNLFQPVSSANQSYEDYLRQGYVGQAKLLGCSVENLRTLDNVHYHDAAHDANFIKALARTIVKHKDASIIHSNPDTGNEYVVSIFNMKIYVYHCEFSESIEITYEKKDQRRFDIMCEGLLRFN